MLDNLDLINRVMKDFSTNQFATKSDLNGAFNELTKSLRNISNMSSEQIASRFLENVKRLMDEKHRYLEENLSDFEKYVKSIPKTSNDKEISKMVAEINDMRSKIEEQETMFANMARTLEKTMKESPKGEIEGLRKEFKAFNKGFENVTVTLNKNFQTFLEQIQKQADNKEFKKLLTTSETLNKNTDDIMSVLSVMDNRYQETKAVLELITNKDTGIFKTLEEFKITASEFEAIVPTLKEVSTKEDFNVLHERLAAIALFLNNLREFLIATDNQNKEKLNEYSMLIEKRLLEVKNTDDVSKLQGELDVLNRDLRGVLNALKTDISNDVINTIEAKSEETQQKFTVQLDKAVNNLSNLANEILALDNALSQTLTGTGRELKLDLAQLQEKIAEILPSFEASLNASFGDKILKLSDSINTVNQDNNTKICDALNYHIQTLRKEIDSILPSTKEVQGSVNNVELLVKEVHELDSATAKNLADITSAVKEDLEKLHATISQIFPSLEETLSVNAQENISKIEEGLATLSHENYVKICDTLNSYMESIEENISRIAPNIRVSLEENVSGKISQIDENVNTANRENAAKICEILNMHLNTLRQSIAEKTTDCNNTIYDKIEGLKNNIENLSVSLENKAAQQDFEANLGEIKNILNGLSSSVNEILNSNLNQNDITSSISLMGDAIENKISIIGDKINSLKDNSEKYFITPETLANLEGLSNDIKTFENAFGENWSQETQSIKENLGQLQEKVEEIEPLMRSFFGDGIENKVNKIQEIITKSSHENYVKIYEIINARIEDFEQNAIEKTTESSATVKETIEALQNEVRASLVGLIDFKGELAQANKSYVETLQESMQKILEGLDNSNMGSELRQLSDTVKQTAQTLEEAFLNAEAKLGADTSNFESETLRNLNEAIPQITDKLEIFKTQFVSDNETIISELKQQFSDAVSNVKSEILEITNSVKEDFTKIYGSVGEELHLDLQNLSNNIIENIEGVNATIMQEFNEHKQNVDMLLSKVCENEEKIQDKFNELQSGIDASVYETRQTLSNTITTVAAEYLETVNGLSTDLLAKMSTVGDISNAGLKEIENLVDKTNRQQILNAKELMEEIQNIMKIQNSQGKIVTQQLDKMGNVNEQIEYLQKSIDEELKAGFHKLASVQNPKEINIALKKIYSQLNEIKANSGDGSYDYTLKDVESDIAKLRLVLEKGGNSEVVKNLSALKSVISDNMKINQNVDQQLSYVNNWLRAAAKTMEILAHKVDKAEKIAQEEIKARLLQTEQNRGGLSQDKLDGITANLVKKYKIQEMRLDNIDEKITSLLQKHGEEPDMKAFIDVFYESISQTKSLTTRVENIENQLASLQKNMEKIISYIEE